MQLHAVKPFQSFNIGKYKIRTLSISQNDDFTGEGMFYAITDGHKTLFYGVDTYVLPEENWPAMKGLIFDTIILDETFGFKNPPNKDHHNIPIFLATVDRLKVEGFTHPETKFYTQHMSHHNPPHDRLTKIMAKHKIIIPYDGLETCGWTIGRISDFSEKPTQYYL